MIIEKKALRNLGKNIEILSSEIVYRIIHYGLILIQNYLLYPTTWN